MALGILLMVSLFVFTAYVIGGYYELQGKIAEQNIMVNIMINPGSNIMMISWQLLYLVLGMAVLGAGIVQFIFALRRVVGSKIILLSTIQFVLGVLIIGILVWFIGWIEPDWSSYVKTLDDGTNVIMKHDSGWVALQISWKIINLLLGLAIAAYGIIPLIAKRKELPIENVDHISS